MIIPRFVILYFGRELPGSTDLVANVGHTLGNALGDDNISPGLDRVRKQYWAKIVQNFATRGGNCYHVPSIVALSINIVKRISSSWFGCGE